jgi:hypothetical protein
MIRRIALAGVLAALVTAGTPAVAAPSGPQVIAAYALAAPASEAASGLVARAVVPAGASCPDLTVTRTTGSRVVPMAVRPTPARTSPAFDAITVCSAPLPGGSSTASIAGVTIPSHLPTGIDRLALLGDTGCRISTSQVQDCASPTAWPLAQLSQSVARARPDAILVNGDFFYREAACPAASQSLCGSSPAPVTGLPFTDSAYGWIADVLLPMAPMLAVAPLVVTRGNHEACFRGGNGYFLLMDPREGTQDTCAPVATDAGLVAAATVPSPSYAIDLAIDPDRTLRLAVVDSAGGTDNQVTSFAALQRPAYEAAARLARPTPGRESWLYTHRPLYALVTTQFARPGVPFTPWGSLDQTAASVGLLGTYDLVFGSHLHLAQAVQIPGLPPQLVLGNGGTLLDPAVGYPLPSTGPELAPGQAYPAPSWAWVGVRFGFAIAEPGGDPGQWRLTMSAPDGSPFARCGLAARQLYCRDLAR